MLKKKSACQCRGHGFEHWAGEIPHATEQLSPWAQLLSLRSRAREPQLLSPRVTTTEARVPRACAPQQEKPPQWEGPARHNERKPVPSNEDPTQPKINKIK